MKKTNKKVDFENFVNKNYKKEKVSKGNSTYNNKPIDKYQILSKFHSGMELNCNLKQNHQAETKKWKAQYDLMYSKNVLKANAKYCKFIASTIKNKRDIMWIKI